MSEEETQILVNEQLTAYLDGELTGEELAAVERRLTDDPDYLFQLQQLQQSWDLLDALPPTQGYDAFVQTTMELVAHDSGVRNTATERTLMRRLGSLAILLLLPGAVFAAGYTVTHHQKTAPYHRLIRDLPLIENHDRYAKLNLEIDFLDRLNEASLFTPDQVLAFPSTPSEVLPEFDQTRETVLSTETIKDRQLRLKQLRTTQLESLKRNKETFDELSPQRKAAIANFHQQLLGRENKVQLFKTMVAYYDWLKSLGATERIEVLDEADMDQRIEMIAAKIERQELRKFGKAGATMLPATDAESFFKWYAEFLKQNKSKIVKLANDLYYKIYRKQSGGKNPPPYRFRQFQRSSLSQKIGFMFQWQEPLMKGLIDEDQVDALRNQLSLDANEILDGNESQEEQKSLVVRWIDAANQAKFNIDPDRLKEFYDSLNKTQRDQLNNLSPRDWKDQLRELYRKKRFNEK
jgi:hypothetical protein